MRVLLVMALAVCCVTGARGEAGPVPPGPTRALGIFRSGDVVGLEEGFVDPPAISRVQCWWQCHGSAFTEADIDRQLKGLHDAGMGGVTVKDTLVMPREEQTAHIEDIPFMSERWVDMFAHCVETCGTLGMICRCRLGSGWNAGGPWVTPEMSSQTLAFAESDVVKGPKAYSGPIPLSGEGEPVFEAFGRNNAFVVLVSAADGHGIDVSGKVTGAREVSVEVPEGEWKLVTCWMAPSGHKVMSASPSGEGLHHDHLSAAGTDLQLAHVAEPILKKLGGFEGTAFDGFNCDSWELGKPLWTDGFREVFETRRGYDPVPYLPWLRLVVDDRFLGAKMEGELPEVGERFLFDVRTTVSELVAETHYARVRDWCHAHGVAFEAEAGGGPSHSLPKDLMLCQGQVDIPMGEFWLRGRSFVKVASSAAHAYGKRLVSLESFTETQNHFAVSPAAMKVRADEAFLLGGNYLTAGGTDYTPEAAGRPGWVHNAGAHLNMNEPWWPVARPFFDYMARCCFMLQSGEPVSHVAVYYTFRTGKDVLWRAMSDDDLGKKPKTFSFDYVNDDLVVNHMAVEDGRIVLPSGVSYSLLYVAPTPNPTMPMETLERVRDLAREGASVVWAGAAPERCPGLTGYPECDEAIRKVGQEIREDGHVRFLGGHDYTQLTPILEELPDPPAWHTEGDTPLRFIQRRMKDADIFFVVNRAGWVVKAPVLFRIQGRVPALWDPDSGEIRGARWRKQDDGVVVDFDMAGHESVFVVFRDGATEEEIAPEPGGTAMDVAGPWEVRFSRSEQAPEARTLEKLAPLNEFEEGGVRHFSGCAAYTTSFACPEEAVKGGVWLDLGEVGTIAEVWVNGDRVGTVWHPPYRVDVSKAVKAGENRLEVRVYTLWHNRIVGDADLEPGKRVTRIVPEKHYERMKGKALVASGLMGPVRVVFGEE